MCSLKHLYTRHSILTTELNHRPELLLLIQRQMLEEVSTRTTSNLQQNPALDVHTRGKHANVCL